MSDNITGSGTYDKQQQAVRRAADWKPKSIRVPGGAWVSYENLGPVGDWLSMTADIMDNFGDMDENDIATNLNAMGFVLSASVTDKTMLASMEPLYDILSGNPDAINRWAGGFLASTVPGAGQWSELNKLIAPQLKVVDNNMLSVFANRTPLKMFLPDNYDWIDGGLINSQDNFLSRVFNAYSPFKVNGKISDEKQFLIDVEYDNRPSMMTDGQGVDLTPEEQSQVYNYMGEHKIFKKEIQRIMQSTDGKAFRKAYADAQAQGVSLSVKDFQNVHIQLTKAMDRAKRYAIAQIDVAQGGALSEQRFNKGAAKVYSRKGDIEKLKELQSMAK